MIYFIFDHKKSLLNYFIATVNLTAEYKKHHGFFKFKPWCFDK